MSDDGPEEPPACEIDVWDGPYKMKCGRAVINGECGRHGKAAAIVSQPDRQQQPLTAAVPRTKQP